MSQVEQKKRASCELPINEQIRSTVDWDINTQPKVDESITESILKVERLEMYFPITKGILKRKIGSVKAVDGVSFQIQKGETFGIVGESGSGKSTVGNCVMRNITPTEGNIIFNGQDITQMGRQHLRPFRKTMTMITQDPFASLDPRMTVAESILEGVQAHRLADSKQEGIDLMHRMLVLVGLNPKCSERYPHEFSGGQRQRISIARALAINPAFVICDEIVSALDVSIQAQIIGLMMKLQESLGLTYIFIGHDLSVVRHISSQVAVMYLGKIMELTGSDELYHHPLHPYTQALISAAPIPNPRADRDRERILLEGEMPSPIHPPKGCNFCTRCQYADQYCMEIEPEPVNVGNNHIVACHKVTAR